MRCAYTIRKPEAAIATTNAVQYISRLKFFGLPFNAAYPITAAINGTTTKKASKNNPASINRLAFGLIMATSIIGNDLGIKHSP